VLQEAQQDMVHGQYRPCMYRQRGRIIGYEAWRRGRLQGQERQRQNSSTQGQEGGIVRRWQVRTIVASSM